MRQTILIVGFGDVGARVAKLLIPRYRVVVLVRNEARAAFARSIGATPVFADLTNRQSLARLAGLVSTVFHFAPPPSTGQIDTHTNNLLAALSSRLAGMLPQRLIYISTTGVYGDCAGAVIDETRPVKPSSARAVRRVSAETVLRAWGARSGVCVSILRAPGIYAADRLPIERLHKGTPALVDGDDVFTNHIHADDLARAAVAAMLGLPNRVYNVVDDSDMKMGAYFDLVADHFKLPRAPRVPRSEACEKIGAAMLSFMSESRRISNARMKQELRVVLRYPTVRDFLEQIRD